MEKSSPPVPPAVLKGNQALLTGIKDVSLFSTGTKAGLRRAGAFFAAQLATHNMEDLTAMRGIGPSAILEICEFLKDCKLKPGDTEPWKDELKFSPRHLGWLTDSEEKAAKKKISSVFSIPVLYSAPQEQPSPRTLTKKAIPPETNQPAIMSPGRTITIDLALKDLEKGTPLTTKFVDAAIAENSSFQERLMEIRKELKILARKAVAEKLNGGPK